MTDPATIAEGSTPPTGRLVEIAQVAIERLYGDGDSSIESHRKSSVLVVDDVPQRPGSSPTEASVLTPAKTIRLAGEVAQPSDRRIGGQGTGHLPVATSNSTSLL